MGFNQVFKNVKKVEDISKGYVICRKNGKNYLEKNGKCYELPDGNIDMVNSGIFINGEKIYVEQFE
ncbi:MAG: hypothetical protein Q4D02_06070 [Clostridia bacterium]|nr:hypothetical protein [Clostridia bacterium]